MIKFQIAGPVGWLMPYKEWIRRDKNNISIF